MQEQRIPPALLAFWLYAESIGADLSEPVRAAESLQAIAEDLNQALETLNAVFRVVSKYDDRRDFLVWSTEHNKFWRSTNHGYTEDPKKAKRFGTALEAVEHIIDRSLNANPHSAYALVSTMKRSLRLVDVQPDTEPIPTRQFEVIGRNIIAEAAQAFSLCPNCIQDFQQCNIDGCKGAKAPGWRGWPVPEELR